MGLDEPAGGWDERSRVPRKRSERVGGLLSKERRIDISRPSDIPEALDGVHRMEANG